MSIAETIAMRFHATYERLAPEMGYTTREASAVPWDEVPEKNRRLMIATVQRLLDRGVIAQPRQEPEQRWLLNSDDDGHWYLMQDDTAVCDAFSAYVFGSGEEPFPDGVIQCPAHPSNVTFAAPKLFGLEVH